MDRVSSADYEARLEKAWAEVDYPKAPLCGECKVPMKRRMAREQDRPFWGCPNYPNCRATHRAKDKPQMNREVKPRS